MGFNSGFKVLTST